MGNMGNSNPKIIAAAFTAAAVIGAGSLFVMHGASCSSVLPGTSAKNEAKPPASSGNVAPKKDASPAKAAEDIVQLAKAHDVAGFSARVTMSRIVPAAADAIKTV